MKALRILAVILVVIVGTCFGEAKTKVTPSRETINKFVMAINARDNGSLNGLFSNDCLFTDANGEVTKGKQQVMARWNEYTKPFTDFTMEKTQVLVQGDTVAVFGLVKCSYSKQPVTYFKIPTCWKLVVHNQQVMAWQVYMESNMPIPAAKSKPLPGATGIGGVFFKSKDAKNLRKWYTDHLHMETNPYGTKFDWRLGNDPAAYGCTQWSVFKDNTTYFAPSGKDFMINYRVGDLAQLVVELRRDNVTVVDTLEHTDYGDFIHILDCDSNKVELWQPKDAKYNEVVGGRAK